MGGVYTRAKEIIKLVCTNFIYIPAGLEPGAEVGKMKFRTNPRGTKFGGYLSGPEARTHNF